MENEVKKENGQSWVQLSDGYLSRTPMFQFVILCLIFPLWGGAKVSFLYQDLLFR